MVIGMLWWMQYLCLVGVYIVNDLVSMSYYGYLFSRYESYIPHHT